MRGRYEIIWIELEMKVVEYVEEERLKVEGIGEELKKNIGINYRRVVKIGIVIV